MLIQPVAKLTCIAIGLFFEGALQGIVFPSIAISNLPVLILLLVSRSRSGERNGVNEPRAASSVPYLRAAPKILDSLAVQPS